MGWFARSFVFSVSPSTLGFPLSLREGLSSCSFLLWEHLTWYPISDIHPSQTITHFSSYHVFLWVSLDWLPYNPSFLTVLVGVISFQIIKLFIVRGEMFLFGILRGKQKSNIFLKSNIFPKSLVKKNISDIQTE